MIPEEGNIKKERELLTALMTSLSDLLDGFMKFNLTMFVVIIILLL